MSGKAVFEFLIALAVLSGFVPQVVSVGHAIKKQWPKNERSVILPVMFLIQIVIFSISSRLSCRLICPGKTPNSVEAEER